MNAAIHSASANSSSTVASGCGCPACRGLQTFSSPIYAAGGLLTADDLASEQAFVRAKMRLHNRYLHGWGTVCGLKVVCDDCDGVVRVEPGYAIDPCGDDIVLAAETTFNVAAAIQACATARPKIGACDPFVPPPDPGCQDVETYWCVTLRYNEAQTAQTAQYLRQSFTAGGCGSSGGCSCGASAPSGGGCSCGGKGASASTTTTTPGTLTYVSPNCAPRRLLECVEIGVEKHDGPCAKPLSAYTRGSDGWTNNPKNVGPLAGLLTLAPPGSLMQRAILCVQQGLTTLSKRMTAADAGALEAIGSGSVGPDVTAQSMHDALCRFRQALLDYMMQHDPVRCQMLAAASGLSIPVPNDQEAAAAYAQRANSTASQLMLAYVQTGLDCLCGSLLPPCPTDPMDLRVPIACVTMRGGKIVDICNHACRRYAGSFPALYYWISALPIVPVLSWVIGALCCGPDAIAPKKTSDLLTNVIAVDPTGAWRNALLKNKFAAPAAFLRTLGGVDLPTLLSAFKIPDAPVSAAAAIGQTGDDAVAALARQGVTAQIEEVGAGASPAANFGPLASSLVEKGANVRLLVNQGVVVGVAPVTAASATADETKALRAQVASLTDRIARLEGGAKP